MKQSEITIENLHKATAQQVFSKIARHLLTQKRCSTTHNGMICAYRSSNGLKCAAGCLFTAQQYKKFGDLIESKNWYAVVEALQANFPKIHERKHLIRALQVVHDEYEPKSWRAELEEIANMYNFKMPRVKGCL